MPQNRTLNRAKRNLLRTGVWALFGLLLVGGFSVANRGVTQAPQAASVAQIAYAGGPAVQSVSGLVSEAGSTAAPVEVCNEACVILASRYQGHEVDLLPAYRWKQSNSMTNTYGASDAVNGNSFYSGIAQLLFMFAGFVWWLLLELIRLALQLDPLFSNSVGKEVNNLFYGISSGISAGFVWFACVATVIVAMVTPLRSKGAPSIMSVVVMVMLPLGTLWAMTTAADPTKDVIGVGSPVWFGRQGVMMIDQTTGFASDVMSNAMTGTKLQTIEGGANNTKGPSCTSYNSALKNAFQAAWETDAARPQDDVAEKKTVLDSPVTPDPATNLRGAQHNGAGTLISLSNLWESAYVPQYIAAEFGGEKAGWDIYCHYMERDTGTSAAEQATVGAAAVGYPATSAVKLELEAISETRVIPVGDRVNPNGDGAGVPATQEAGDTWPEAGPYIGTDPTWGAKEKKEQAQLMLWAACKNSGDVFTAKPGWVEYGDLTDAECSAWWSSGAIVDKLQWSEDNARDNKWASCSSKEGDCASEVSQMYLAMHGKNAGQRVFAGAFSLATAAAYMYVFGMVGLGVLIAKVGLLLMLMALPVTLFLLALPKWRVDPKTAQRNATGMKLMRKTFGFAAATAVFQLVVVFAVLTIALIRSVLYTFTGGLGGTVDMISPLLALFLMTKMMKQLGLGNLTRPSGALGLAAAAAVGAGADKGKGFGAMKNRAAKNKGLADKGVAGKFQENKGEQKAREAMAKHKAKRSGEFNPTALAALSAGGLASRTAAAAKALDEAKTPKQKAEAKAKLDNALKEGAERDQKALAGLGASESAAALGKGASEDAKRALKQQNVQDAIADATRRGLSGGDALANESMKSDGNKALDKAAAAISAASGGAVSTADARASLEGGHKMGAFVQKADGSVVSAAEALSSGHASLSASGVMTGAAGATVMTARGAAAMGALARTHDASYSAAGSQEAAKGTTTGLGAAAGGCNVAPVRGTGGMLVPANTASGFVGGAAACGTGATALLDSRAGLPMALSASTAGALMQAAGGDSTRAAALYQEAMTMRGCETSSLGGVLDQTTAGQNLVAALGSAGSAADAESAWEAYRNSGDAISLSDSEISHCISAAESRHQADMAAECATFSEPVRSAGVAAQESLILARAEMQKATPDAGAVTRHMADAAGFLAVAEQGQQDLNNFISSNGSMLPSGNPVDVGAATAQAQASASAALVGASTGMAFRLRLKDDMDSLTARVQNVGNVVTAPRSYSRSHGGPRTSRPTPVPVP